MLKRIEFRIQHSKSMPSSKGRRSSNAQGYQPIRGGPESSPSLFPSLGRRVSPDREERPAERPLDRNQRIQPQPTINKTIAPGQVSFSYYKLNDTPIPRTKSGNSCSVSKTSATNLSQNILISHLLALGN